ncbi:hypothetical protein LTR16_001353 [Cryomyces antarcticus]|uniref:F-box domain-containing protein n=1 Tax=Cryomyces antarcticus TaxID=329879 RepID=A0ABR0KU09_9PEZI|nr:hypothetical protein LTR16_001353 [Cryomyces antarcticus]
MDSDSKPPSPLLALPAELIDYILTVLPPTSLATLSQTCRLLHTYCLDEQLWMRHVNSNLPFPLKPASSHRGPLSRYNPSAVRSFRDLYARHHPHWFLPRHRIWFADSGSSGKLLVARYDERTGAVEAYAVTALRGPHIFSLWEYNNDVIIHSFTPQVQLDLNQPVVKLEGWCSEDVGEANPGDTYFAMPRDDGRSRLGEEIRMNLNAPDGLFTSFMLARPLPSSYCPSPGTFVWPPLILPARGRTRNLSLSSYRGTGHKPSSHAEVSETAFRLRRWVEYRSRGEGIGTRMGEHVLTFATLPAEAWTPTAKKPWRGIWCGDYSGHGCEFLVVLQPDKPGPLPVGALTRRSESFSSTSSYASAAEELLNGNGEIDESAVEEDAPTPATSSSTAGLTPGSSTGPSSLSDGAEGAGGAEAEIPDDPDDIYHGRIEAIKLTGDPNVPCGEYTFIAPDIGPAGFVRTAMEAPFRDKATGQGARVVKSVGHIAARGFRDDEYIPSQLVLIDHDRMAQYWEPFGHISFYQRVDVDALLRFGIT